MSISLETRASTVVAGRCSDCGRFISRHESHFHGPKRKFAGPPRAHIWLDDGAMVTRCDDIEQARQLAMRRWRWLNDESREEAEERLPVGSGEVQRGRILVQPPESEYSWVWYPLPDDAKGPGVTTAVVWYW